MHIHAATPLLRVFVGDVFTLRKVEVLVVAGRLIRPNARPADFVFGTGAKIQVGPFDLYREGIIAGSGIVVKGTLGVLTAIILSTSTTAREILRGLERLRLPALMVQIASFMLRYVNVVNDEMERMKVARESRGFEATGIQHWKVLATAAGALFIRSYERGERVHLSMLSRGYDGVLPQEEVLNVPIYTWIKALMYPLIAIIIFATNSLIGNR